ncbi:PIN domain-containing protein [Aquiluna borgnonia]|uniref:PIN domain-containing protein n=1 Tax=Aquiluna borgnonia TaxID=2499157 RepID=A0A7D4Q3E7_9MICO|nr:PIN domain-containing protein [Aquiluna borgnonia]QKJ24709.1 PIN domain-containing protein [Aquiluna borgnonia]
MRSLLDTNVLTHLHLKPARIGPRTRQSLESAVAIYFSPITIFEWLQKDDFLGTNTERLTKFSVEMGFQELPLTAAAAFQAKRFGILRGSDPLDFLILSQAAQDGLDLFTSDSRLLDLGLDFVRDSSL